MGQAGRLRPSAWSHSSQLNGFLAVLTDQETLRPLLELLPEVRVLQRARIRTLDSVHCVPARRDIADAERSTLIREPCVAAARDGLL